ncbi:GntR family transcriptional regulator [Sporosarcina thermotolerans]|uniref:GntR family transcriptional regulator n=1 Tax=Sporosarcina thermotolerans TaxID=633404 RepID=A0AAW9A7U1_9BACL|nr:GntR family transcriptional regulator [Sporosarcina thermotolerans]MDW0117477.1 GntR family transcriptional regulator [Sporosarcina thermotolerans]WHT49652.1 GntR family transcriptional regulator [Sporosarcina thermotolerans]
MISGKERGEMTEFVYNLLKKMIFEWSLTPGQKINISHLTREFNVSAIPLREALSRLSSEKLVILEPNKGYSVSGILDEESITKMLEARILLETHAIRNIIRSNNLGVIEELSELTEQMFSVSGSINKKILDFTHLDQEFHRSILKAGENSFLLEAYEGMHCHLHIGRFYHIKGELDQKDAPTEHLEIIEAIRTRDVYKAEQILTNHIQDSTNRLLGKQN